MIRTRGLAATWAAAMAWVLSTGDVAGGPEPIKVGLSMALTGSIAVNGKQVLAALEIWRDDVNAHGGLLGRPVELVCYDDQSNPANVPSIYTKLISLDKVDLLIGPYATNMIAAAIPVIAPYNMMTLGIFGLEINRQFHYPKYFSMLPTGPEGVLGFSKGFFDLAGEQSPTPKTVAITAADAEFARTAAEGARVNAASAGLDIVYDRRYPPSTMDFAPIVRAIQAADPDLVFVASYPPDSVGIVRAVNEVGLSPKMFGGAMIGLLSTNIKMALGPLLNGIVNHVDFVPAPGFAFPGLEALIKRYQAKASTTGLDPLGYEFPPFAYAAGQVLANAVEMTESLDQDRLAAYLRDHSFQTVIGELSFAQDGEWAKTRSLFTQFQHVTGNDLGQFRDWAKEVVLWPPEYKSGDIIYPYATARK
jgi:branched-chain amino acid transport system substrate-binding protein